VTVNSLEKLTWQWSKGGGSGKSEGPDPLHSHNWAT